MTTAQKIIDTLRPGQTWSAFFAETRHREDITIQSTIRWTVDPWGDEYGFVDVALASGEPLLVTVDDLVRMSVILTADPDFPIYQGVPMVPGVKLYRTLTKPGRPDLTLSFTVKGLENVRGLDEPQVELIGESFDIIATVGELAKMKLVVGSTPALAAPTPAWVRRPDDDSPKPGREVAF